MRSIAAPEAGLMMEEESGARNRHAACVTDATRTHHSKTKYTHSCNILNYS